MALFQIFFWYFCQTQGFTVFSAKDVSALKKIIYVKQKAVKLSLENGDENGFHSFVLALDLLSAAVY